MPLQLIRASKTLITVDPVADIWGFTSVPAKVGSKVGGLAINLGTIWKTANMLLLSQSAVALLARVHPVDAIQAGACNSSEPALRQGRLAGSCRG